jgi:quercetin dioxygenase-like cupin family protein
MAEDAMLPLEMVAAPLSLLLPEVEPDPGLFSRIAAAAGISAGVPGFHVCRTGETVWKAVAEGIRIRTLSDRRPGGRLTILMQMDPGAVMPEHQHEADEECYVIEGAFTMDGSVYRSGDFLIAHKGSLHPAVTSPAGCLVLLTMDKGGLLHKSAEGIRHVNPK